jgi:hypothetical protein
VAHDTLIPAPVDRKLRIFAFDPSVSAQFDTAGIGEITISVPWERTLTRGPVGEYLEVVDADPASQAFYQPIDLNHASILAQNGLAPSETNPLFHQQMVYAVAMTTIGHFEQALGRVALWSGYRAKSEVDARFVRRLRIYPHALRERNAYYSPSKKALLFGYFPVGVKDSNNTPGTIVFSCLSHDIIAHETTHALLDGVHPRFNEPVNPDVQAFHEAFADVVALFQHFSYPGVLRDQIGRSRGNLESENLLGQLAQQFGKSSGRSTALRDAIGGVDDSGKWKPRAPDPSKIDRTMEPHDRGAILVAAIFGAFLKVYRARTADLYRIASEGTGVLRAGDIPADLISRLAEEAARSAQNVLQMCIRAIDYCPPVGPTFGDYLRAIVTADYDLNPGDPLGYRLAFVEAFRQWGIHPQGMRSMSIEALLWPAVRERESVPGADPLATFDLSKIVLSLFTQEQRIIETNAAPRSSSGEPAKKRRSSSREIRKKLQPWNLESDRHETWKNIQENARVLWSWLMTGDGRPMIPLLGLVVDDTAAATIVRSSTTGGVAVEVHSVRTALRRSPRGAIVSDLVVEITQRRRGYFDAAVQAQQDKPGTAARPADFMYRAGCTVLIDPVTTAIRRVIRTRGTIADNDELDRVRRFLVDGGVEGDTAYYRDDVLEDHEPFAMLHLEPEL